MRRRPLPAGSIFSPDPRLVEQDLPDGVVRVVADPLTDEANRSWGVIRDPGRLVRDRPVDSLPQRARS